MAKCLRLPNYHKIMKFNLQISFLKDILSGVVLDIVKVGGRTSYYS